MMSFVRLLRPYQYYKNVLIFLPIIFAAQLQNMLALRLTLIGFVALCCMSSVNYIINDIIDCRKDREHPQKRHRPIASGKVSIPSAAALAAVLFALGLFIGFGLSMAFGLIQLFFFVLTFLYSVFLKEEPFVDILLISVNFMLRSVIGAFVIAQGFSSYVPVSAWLILGTFFLALFLAVSKREADLMLLGSKAESHRTVLQYYDLATTHGIRLISATLLITTYALYAFFGRYHLLLASIPLVLYAIFRYSQMVQQGSAVGRDPHLVFRDVRMVIVMVLWLVLAVVAVYVPVPF